MTDMENVIKGLWCCNHAGNCSTCPFDIKGGTDRDEKGRTCLQNLIAAAYDALKAQEPPKNASISSAIECLLHPQDADDSDMAQAIDTAVRAMRLLKAQEPRVMTLEEVKDFNWDYCYLEEERLPGKEYRAVCGDYALTCITWPSVTSMRIQHGDESYGKEWRCWTSRPDKATREATPWQGSSNL